MKTNFKQAVVATIVGMGLLLLTVIALVAIGGHHHRLADFMSNEMQLGVYGCAAGVAASLIAIWGSVRTLSRHLKMFIKERKGDDLGYVVVCLFLVSFVSVELMNELARTSRVGFSPDPLRRTIAMSVFFLAAVTYLMMQMFPEAFKLPEEETASKDCAKEKLQPLTLPSKIVLGLFAVAGMGYAFYAMRDRIGYLLSPHETEPQALVQTGVASSQQEPPKTRLANPATLDELSRAFVCIGRDEKDLLGSGFLMGTIENGRRRVFLVSAAHVAAACRPQPNGDASIALMIHNTVDAEDAFYKVKDGANRWIVNRNGTDLAIIELTDDFDDMVKVAGDVRYIRLSSAPLESADELSVAGVVVLPRSHLQKYGIGLGMDVRVMGYAGELWMSSVGRTQQPLAIRAGHISSRIGYFDDETPDETAVGPIVIESGVRPGFSGGPVFAYTRIGNVIYPALIGVVRSVLYAQDSCQIIQGIPVGQRTLSGYAQVTPLDIIIREGTKPNAADSQFALLGHPGAGTQLDTNQAPLGRIETVKIVISKGETVIDPPFVDSIKHKAMTYTNEFRDFKPLPGDYVAWGPESRRIKWTYDGRNWCMGNQAYRETGIPLGHLAFVYGREQDVTSTMTLRGFIDPVKEQAGKARSEGDGTR